MSVSLPIFIVFFFPRKNKFSPINFQDSARESLQVPEKKLEFSPRKKSHTREKISKIAPEETISGREKNQKFQSRKIAKDQRFSLIYARGNLILTREKKSFNAQEIVRVPEKHWCKSGRGKMIPPRKNPKKKHKNAFSGTSHFLGKKKHCLYYKVATDCLTQVAFTQ